MNGISLRLASRNPRRFFAIAAKLAVLLIAATCACLAQTTATANIVAYGNNVVNANIPRFEGYDVDNNFLTDPSDVALAGALPRKISHIYLFTYYSNAATYAGDFSTTNPSCIQVADDRLGRVAAQTDSILVTLEKGGNARERLGYDLLQNGTISLADFSAAVQTCVSGLKSRFPNVNYIEVLNETNPYPDGSYTPRFNYYQIYQVMQQAVDNVNATLPSGATPIKIGPNHTLQYFRDFFLPLYKADPSTTKHVDFVGTHQYLFEGTAEDPGNPNAGTAKPPTYPIDLWNLRSDPQGGYDAAFAGAGIPTNTPVFETEFGGYPGDGTIAQESEVVGAGSLTEDWIFLNKWHDAVGFWFQESDPSFFSQIYPFGAHGIPLAPYNMRAMLQKLKANQVYSSDPVIDSRGYGVYQIATVDSTGAAILVWNYSGFDGIQTDQPQPTTYNTIVSIYNLPDVFYNGYHIDQYQVDLTTSNYYGNSSNYTLQDISSFDVPGQNYMTQGATLGPNAATLFLLTPNAN